MQPGDKLFNERETLNGNLDCSNDAAFHQPESKVPAETVRELATAAILLEQTNALLDRVSERQSQRPAVNQNSQAPAINDDSVLAADNDGDDEDQPEKLDLCEFPAVCKPASAGRTA